MRGTSTSSSVSISDGEMREMLNSDKKFLLNTIDSIIISDGNTFSINQADRERTLSKITVHQKKILLSLLEDDYELLRASNIIKEKFERTRYGVNFQILTGVKYDEYEQLILLLNRDHETVEEMIDLYGSFCTIVVVDEHRRSMKNRTPTFPSLFKAMEFIYRPYDVSDTRYSYSIRDYEGHSVLYTLLRGWRVIYDPKKRVTLSLSTIASSTSAIASSLGNEDLDLELLEMSGVNMTRDYVNVRAYPLLRTSWGEVEVLNTSYSLDDQSRRTRETLFPYPDLLRFLRTNKDQLGYQVSLVYVDEEGGLVDIDQKRTTCKTIDGKLDFDISLKEYSIINRVMNTSTMLTLFEFAPSNYYLQLLSIVQDSKIMSRIGNGEVWDMSKLQSLRQYAREDGLPFPGKRDRVNFHWFITNEYGKVVGYIALHPMIQVRNVDEPGSMQIRVLVREKKRGHAKEAIYKAITYYRYMFGYSSNIYSVVAKNNYASIQLMNSIPELEGMEDVIFGQRAHSLYRYV